jgi:hypothetical protein
VSISLEGSIYIMILLTGKSIWFQSFLIYTNLLKHLTMQQYCIKEIWNILLFSECMWYCTKPADKFECSYVNTQIPMWTNRNGKNITVRHVYPCRSEALTSSIKSTCILRGYEYTVYTVLHPINHKWYSAEMKQLYWSSW